MLKRLRLSPQSLMFVEAAFIGLFFVQALRFLVGMLYTRSAGASITSTLDQLGLAPATGAVDTSLVQSEITFVIVMLGLPLLGLLLTRVRWMIYLALLLVVIGRVLMNANVLLTPTAAAALVVGGGLLYLAFVIRWRANLFPYFFILGLAADQLIRAYGNTLDPSWSPAYLNTQIALSFVAALIGLIALIWSETRPQPSMPGPQYGTLPFWGGIGLGALLFLELALLSLPNAAAARADYDYTLMVPLMMAATLLPIVPAVRARFAGFISTFDTGLRGWLWMLLLMLLLVFGTRIQGPIGGISLVLAQFAASMIWWWQLRRRTATERSFTPIWLILAILVFALLVAFDTFTYEYPYVRSFTGDFAFLNDVVLPVLRGFAGLGLAVIILTAFLAALPMTQIRQRIPWTGGSTTASAASLIVVIGVTLLAGYLARPPVVPAAPALATMRAGTYNIHAGTDEFFTPSLSEIRDTILQSGANVVLLQEAEAGRLTSFGVDQPLWLARQLGMDRRFYPTMEGLRGLAVLSNMPIAYDDGTPLASSGEPTGLQRVQIQPTADSVIEVYNTWLNYLLESADGAALDAQEQDQQRQLNQIFQVIADQHPGGVLGQTILGGTFNNVPDSPLMDQLRSVGFSDPFAGLPLELAATLVRTGVPEARLDYLWLRNLSPAEGVLVLDSDGSDHRLAVTGIALD